MPAVVRQWTNPHRDAAAHSTTAPQSGRPRNAGQFTVLESTPERTLLEFRLNAYSLHETTFRGRTVSVVRERPESMLKQRNAPALPFFRTDLIVPPGTHATAIAMHGHSHDVACAPPIPSVGFVERGKSGATPLADFGAVYAQATPFPAERVALTDVARLRHVPFVGVVCYPFEYVPDRGVLRVHERVQIEIRTGPANAERPSAPGFPAPFRNRDFAAVAQQRFANSAHAFRGEQPGGDQAAEAGTATRGGRDLTDTADKLLIIADSGLAAGIAPLVAWKQQRGLSVSTALYPDDTGSGSTAVDTFIQNHYDQNQTMYVILVGDYTDIPDHTNNGARPSDTLYTLADGTDYYHDMFISRVSVSTLDGLANQVQKIVNYESSPDTNDGAWYGRACMVASNEGKNTDPYFLYDWEILNGERAKLLGVGYTDVDQIYDGHSPSPTPAAVTDAWDAGRSLLYYLGHGTETGWNTSGFNTTYAAGLQNGAALPFVLNGNCRNGDFTYHTDCLAEAMMKAGTAQTPAGAVSVIASTTNMDWTPPIVMVEAFTGYLTGQSPIEAGPGTPKPTYPYTGLRTAGGFAFFSIQRAMDYCYGSVGKAKEDPGAAQKIMEQTHVFGDCTLGVRTRTPVPLTVQHPPQLVPGDTFALSIQDDTDTPVAGATVCLFRDPDLQVVGTTDANGQATLSPGLLLGDPVTLTVYERNAVPYQTQLAVADGTLFIYSADVLPTAFAGLPYSYTFAAAGGATPYTWSLEPNAPAWLTEDTNTGTVSGTPTQPETLSFTMQVADSASPVATFSQTVSLTVGRPVDILTTSLPQGTVQTAYDQAIDATGSFPPFTFAADTRLLPPGISLETDGQLHGTPSLAGTYSFAVTATDQQQQTNSESLSLTILPSDTVAINTRSALSDAERAQPYTTVFSASGGSGSGFVWTVVAGALPPGLGSLTPSGTLSGTPTHEGHYTFTLEVADDQQPPHTARASFTLDVYSKVYLTTAVLPDAAVDVPYQVMVPLGGSYPPFTCSEPAQTDYSTDSQASTFAAVGELQTDWRTPDKYTDNEWTLDLGFTFPFFGSEYTSCVVGNNGYITFGGASLGPEHWNATVDRLRTHAMIAPFWTDLVISEEDSPESTGIFVHTGLDAVTIRWVGLDYHYVTGQAQPPPEIPLDQDVVNMSVTLNADGRIELRYGDVQTTNRFVVGMSAGNNTDYNVQDSHAWNSNAPEYVTTWLGHDDVIYRPVVNLPTWLSLSAGGQLTGTPTDPGPVTFNIQVEDAQANQINAQLSLTVTQEHDADANGDGQIDNDEILVFADLWAAGTVTEEEFLQAVAVWRSGSAPQRGAGTDAPSRLALPQPTPRLGRVLIVQIEVTDEQRLRELLFEGHDVASVRQEVVTIYATPAEVEQLQTAGYTPVVLDEQFVGQSAEAKRAGERAPPSGYTTYQELTAELAGFAGAYADICRVVTLGQSVADRDLWAIRITDNPTVEEDEPEVRIVGAIHGNEPVGAEMCLRLAELLVTNYGGADATGQRVTQLVDETEIWLVPCMNPDGYETQVRYNQNGLDLNRSFPDGVALNLGTVFQESRANTVGLEPEVAAVSAWNAAHSFVLSATLHTGDLLVCYPYGNNEQGASVDTPTPDDELFRYLAREYALNNPDMVSNSTYPEGIVNAADWYIVSGEMADWCYRFLGTFEVTPELSHVKAPAAANLPALWQANSEAMLRLLEAAHIGVRGLVTDSATGAPLRACVRVAGNRHPVFTDPDVGDYQRLLLPGTVGMEFEAPGYWVSQVLGINVNAQQATRLDVPLTPTPHAVSRLLGRGTPDRNQPLTVTLQIGVDAQQTPNALIVSEVLPDGVTYVASSTHTTTRDPLPEPRLSGQTAAWLFYGTDAASRTITYQLNVPNDATHRAHFTGRYESTAGDIPVQGDMAWPLNGQVRCQLALKAGWNLFSIPIVLDNPNIAEALGKLTNPTVWSWNGTCYRAALTLEAKQGYWLFCENDVTITLVGSYDDDTVRPFNANWNLFGALSSRSSPTGPFTGAPLGWNGNAYTATSILLDGHGYWIYSSQATPVDVR